MTSLTQAILATETSRNLVALGYELAVNETPVGIVYDEQGKPFRAAHVEISATKGTGLPIVATACIDEVVLAMGAKGSVDLLVKPLLSHMEAKAT